ncbi:MAG TPA: paraquat-inducible protein A [Burkholderiaceae bacterium]|nr:paraquat-inducible protein A [Burkholderiaceae bacterium]
MSTVAALAPATEAAYVLCEECDAAYPAQRVRRDDLLRCRRCGAVLARGHGLPLDGQLALTLGALAVFAIGSLSPIVTLELSGIHTEATLLEATRLTWNSGAHLVAAISIATAFVFPLLVIALRLWVLVPLVLRRPVALLAPVMRLLRWVLRWSMVEVFMLGVLIAVVRSAGVTHVVLGAGIFAYMALTVLLTAIHAAGLQALWAQAVPRRRLPARAATARRARGAR